MPSAGQSTPPDRDALTQADGTQSVPATMADSNILRIDTRQDDVQRAVGRAARAAQPAGQRGQRGRPAAHDRSVWRAAEPRGRSSNESATTCATRGWRPCSIIRPASIGPISAARRCACRPPTGGGPCGGRSRVSGRGPPHSRQHARLSTSPAAARRARRRAGRQLLCGSGICRWSGLAFACRAARRRIRRPC